MLGILLTFLSVACAAGFIWLLIRAFQTSVVWGILVFLFSPITATIFAIKHWEEAKKPYLLYATTICSALILAIYMIMSSGIGEVLETSIELAKETEQSTLTEEEAAKILGEKVSGKVFEMAKKFADAENDKAFLGILHRYVNTRRTGSNGPEQNELKKDILDLLKRPDFTEDQRKGFRNILKELNEQNKITVSRINTPADPKPLQAEMAALKNQEPSEVLPEVVSGDPNGSLRPGKISIEDDPLSPKNHFVEEFQSDLLSAEPEAPSSLFKTIHFAQAKQYIGTEIVFLNPGGGEEKCFLVDVSEGELRCEKRFNAGTFSTTFDKSEVKSLKVIQN